MMIPWFEDRILASIPPTEANLDRFYRYACIYTECGQQTAALACALCRLVVECRFRGSSMYGAIQAYTGDNKVYYLPHLPMVSREYESLDEFLNDPHYCFKSMKSLGHDLCAIFSLTKRLQIDLNQLLLVALVAAELLMTKGEEEMVVPVVIDMEQVERMFSPTRKEI